MEQKDRDKIDLHCDKVVPKIKITKLWPKLLEHKIYNLDDVNIPQWEKNLTAGSTIKDIFSKIQTRGPKAYERLLLSLKESGHEDICDILEDKVKRSHENNNNKYDNTHVSYVNKSFHHIELSDEPLKIKLQKAVQFVDDENGLISLYPMRSNPRGLVLLITNILYEKPRLAAEHDENNLTELFQEMGFHVISKKNLKGKEIKDEVKKFSKREELANVDSCFVIISSHGRENEVNHGTEILGVDTGQKDAEKVFCDEILDYFTVDACSKMAGKPKIFIFQLCRGLRKQKIKYERLVTDIIPIDPENMDEEVKPDNTILLGPKYSIRNYADMLVVYSTLPGHVAYRDTETGSWFIQILCSVFMSFARECHVQDLFNIIDSQLQRLRTSDDNCQTSTVQSIGFNRRCYLNPGYFSDEHSANET
ncbi:PREDICTED: caspase-3-like [Dinoponera quadriceps]|uniref:Caspase-3-like n=1 Tax=Dinoponera quadriceps TaxID=609295 RepID=A0A6P3WYQ7_DINQU|nr:PREDICTED: caspase-3-like [Dinoponera quadriceps]